MAGPSYSATIGSTASGWINIMGGTSFSRTLEELCGSGSVGYESSEEITCNNGSTAIYGVLAYACPPKYLPFGYPALWEMKHLGASSGFGVAENGYVYLGLGLGGAAACYNNSPLQTLNLTLTPVLQTPPDPRPKGAEGKDGKSTLDLIAKVVEGGSPKAGVTVGFGVAAESYTGGHAHGDLGSISRPKGGLSNMSGVNIQSGVTDSNGEIKLRFIADQPAGLHAIVADCAPAGCNAPAKQIIKVKVPDLIHIPPDTETPERYILVGNVGDASNNYKTFQHNLTHYLTEQSWVNFKILINTFIDLEWGQIGVNDASLEWGGLFDIEGKWTTSGGHAEHRDGKQVDISFVRPNNISADKRKKVFDEICSSKGASLPVVLWHQNDGYAPHFHIYLTGQGVTGTKKQCSNK